MAVVKMPTYVYRCGEGHEFEVKQKIKDKPVKSCQKCNAIVQRVPQTVSISLKGDGWAKDGYSKK